MRRSLQITRPYLKSKRLKWLLFKKIYSLVITLNEDDQLKKKELNKHLKFDENFDIQHQLEHFEYVMIHTLDKILD